VSPNAFWANEFPFFVFVWSYFSLSLGDSEPFIKPIQGLVMSDLKRFNFTSVFILFAQHKSAIANAEDINGGACDHSDQSSCATKLRL
jgi:hypothetical protein